MNINSILEVENKDGDLYLEIVPIQQKPLLMING